LPGGCDGSGADAVAACLVPGEGLPVDERDTQAAPGGSVGRGCPGGTGSDDRDVERFLHVLSLRISSGHGSPRVEHGRAFTAIFVTADLGV